MSGAVDAAAFNEMGESAQHMHLYQRLVSIEGCITEVVIEAKNARGAATMEVRGHAASCLKSRQIEAKAVAEVANEGNRKLQFAYSVIVLLVGILCTAAGLIIGGV